MALGASEESRRGRRAEEGEGKGVWE